jgi:hypothetical protein
MEIGRESEGKWIALPILSEDKMEIGRESEGNGNGNNSTH